MTVTAPRKKRAPRGKFILRPMPPDLKQMLIDRAEREETSVNDVAVGLIAVAFKFPFEPLKVRRARASKSAESLVLEMPEKLRWQLRNEALKRHTDGRALALQILREALTGKAT
jgi:hypothetical protein